jgi:hypothetical protein
MIWALLAMLGVPIWLIVGVLLSVWLSRKKFRAQDGVFALSIRPQGEKKWPRTVAYVRCFRGVIAINRGVALANTSIHEIDGVGELKLDEPPRKPADAVGRVLTLKDGSSFEVAIGASDAARLDALISR